MVLGNPQTQNTELPKALWVSPVSDLGGVARHFADVAKVGIPGFNLVFMMPQGPLADQLLADGAEVEVAQFGPQFGFWRSRKSLIAAIGKFNPTVVHSHLAFADIVLAATPIAKPGIRVSTEHGIAAPNIYHGSEIRSRIMRLVHTIKCQRFDALVAVSESTKQVMQKLWRPRTAISVIYNGVDLPAGTPNKQAKDISSLTILSLARLSQEKRIDDLLRAFAILRQGNPAARLQIAGDGPEAKYLKRLSNELGVAEYVDFLGFVEPNAALENADVLVQLSKWENCSYTLLDAKSRGLAVVATAVGGNPEIIEADSLVNKIDHLALAQLISSRSKGISESAPKWSWPTVSQMTAQIALVYRESLKR